MTGYGRADEQNDKLALSVEIHSVNSRFLDFSPRIPKSLQCFEDDAYKIVKQICKRGRISLSAKIDFFPGTKNGMLLNQDKLEEYMTIVKDIQQTSDRDDIPSMGDILRLPDILLASEPDDENGLKDIFLSALKNALDEMGKIRQSEGENIQSDLIMRLSLIKNIVDEIRTISELNRDVTFERYKKKIQNLVEDVSVDESRLLQEAAILSEKKDITEELVRLGSHIDLFERYIDTSENKGKKLNFILQEMGREINTIGSKTDVIEINHMVVDMKDELEKIREQVQNIV
tara:strand:- start:119 stop:982 length:864 start_codon:yes stop_codon:yes gene_type:complete